MDTDIIVIGAGVIGLAAGEKLARAGYAVTLLEREKRFGTGISSRNTETIHAGIYYAKDSLKARLCLRGKNLLYEYCEKNNVPHKKLGKLFLAVTESEIPRLDRTLEQARANGLEDLEIIEKTALKKLEPELNGAGALLCLHPREYSIPTCS